MRLILLLAGLAVPVLTVSAYAAPSPVGKWLTEDRSGVIEIAPCGEGLCGRIVGQDKITDAQGRPTVDAHGQPHCGLLILRADTQTEPGHWSGVITDPDDGSDWKCQFWVDEGGSLRLRGYVLIPLLGQTQTWPAFHGSVAPNCAITP